jgi:5-methylthioadenosine/S-adenosylhomocysteine deaminase
MPRTPADAAQVMGLGDEIGSLDPGKKADLVLVDLDRPHPQPLYGDVAALVFYARADDVTTSIVDGTIVMGDRRIVRVDEAPIRAAISALHDGQSRCAINPTGDCERSAQETG